MVESIQIMGHDVYYMPREDFDERDKLFGENVYSYFQRAYPMEMYILNVDGYQGDGEFFSKFGLEIRDTTNIVVARRTFDRYIPKNITTRAREGDLIYIPVLQKLFEIKFVEGDKPFYTFGQQDDYLYEMSCEAFRYAHERINTGISTIDDIESRIESLITITLNTGSNNFVIGEVVYQGDSYAAATSTANVANWIPANNTIYLKNVTGTGFSSGVITGVSSNITRSIADSNPLSDSTYYDMWDNSLINDEKNNYINNDEGNPFGSP